MIRGSGPLDLTFFGKSIMATIVLWMAILQAIVIAVARGWVGDFSQAVRVRVTGLHHFQGYAALVIILLVAYNCVFMLGLPKTGPARVIAHALLGLAVLLLLMKKILIVRVFTRYYRWLPLLGTLLFVAIAALWVTSAGWYFMSEGFSY